MPDPPSLRPLDAPDQGEPPALPSHAICVYAEPLIVGRRVVVVGDASLGLGERLLDLGARTVHVYHLGTGRAEARAPVRGLVTRDLSGGEFDVRDGAFDVAIIMDIGVAPNPEDLLARVRRVLAKGGSALVGAGSHSADAIEYYELYERVALQFSHVRMIAEVPFTGVALADLSLEGNAPEVTVDTQLGGAPSSPERYFALGSQDDVRLSEYAIVQIPPVPGDSREDAARRDADDRDRATLAEAQLRATFLEAQVDELKAFRQAESAENAPRLLELQARLAEESARLREADARAAEHYKRAERCSEELREIGTELARERDRATLLGAALGGAESEAAALKNRLAESDLRLARRETELARYEETEARVTALAAEVIAISDGHAVELEALEKALRERARVVRELEQEVARREGIVRELLASLEEARIPGTFATPGTATESGPSGRDLELARMDLVAVRRDLDARHLAVQAANEQATTLEAMNDDLRARLDALSSDVARRESERQEIVWRVGELEQQISRLEAEQTELTDTLPPPPMGKSPMAPTNEPDGAARLQTEIDILRQAIAQEHEARVRAESGEELSSARAELARQALLLEQLSRELEVRDRTRATESEGHASSEA